MQLINIIIIIIIIIKSVEQMADKRVLVRRNKGFLAAIHDQVVLTRNYKKYILKQPETDELCRRCGKESETIQHITAACEQLAHTEYVKRHDGLAKIILQKLTEVAELIEDKCPYYKYTPAVYWRMKISSCPGIAAYLRTKQYHLIDLTLLL